MEKIQKTWRVPTLLIKRDHAELLLAITYVNKYSGAKNKDLGYFWHMFIRSE